jgi:16S rRNA (uracil1498-N3)-methyltransferase
VAASACSASVAAVAGDERALTAPVFLLRPLPETERLILDGPEGRHAASVKRLRPGERIDVTDGEGRVAECVVTSAGRDRLQLEVVARRFIAETQPRVVVAQALVKGERSELAVDLLTEVGVDEILPWAAARCVASWVPEKSGRRWEQAAASAAKQARRPRWPIIADVHGSSAIASRIGECALALVLHEDAGQPLAKADLPSSGDVLIVVGPEGGITDEELAAFEAAGARSVRLGPSVLRASTAGCVAAAVVLSATGRWSRS